MRPKDWKNPYAEPIREGVSWNKEVIRAYEEGADAILETLCTDENKLDCSDQWDCNPPYHKKGWLVFIPEEE